MIFDKLQKALEALPEAVIICEARTQDIVFVNSAAATMFGYTETELRTLRISDLIPDDERERHDTLIAEYEETPKRRKMGTGLKLRGKAKNGTIIHQDIALGPFESDGVKYVLAVIIDMATAQVLEVLNDVLAKVKAANAELAAGQRDESEAGRDKSRARVEAANEELAAAAAGRRDEIRARVSAATTELAAAMTGQRDESEARVKAANAELAAAEDESRP